MLCPNCARLAVEWKTDAQGNWVYKCICGHRLCICGHRLSVRYNSNSTLPQEQNEESQFSKSLKGLVFFFRGAYYATLAATTISAGSLAASYTRTPNLGEDAAIGIRFAIYMLTFCLCMLYFVVWATGACACDSKKPEPTEQNKPTEHDRQ